MQVYIRGMVRLLDENGLYPTLKMEATQLEQGKEVKSKFYVPASHPFFNLGYTPDDSYIHPTHLPLSDSDCLLESGVIGMKNTYHMPYKDTFSDRVFLDLHPTFFSTGFYSTENVSTGKVTNKRSLKQTETEAKEILKRCYKSKVLEGFFFNGTIATYLVYRGNKLAHIIEEGLTKQAIYDMNQNGFDVWCEIKTRYSPYSDKIVSWVAPHKILS